MWTKELYYYRENGRLVIEITREVYEEYKKMDDVDIRVWAQHKFIPKE